MPTHRQRLVALTARAAPPAALAAALFTSGCAGPLADLSAQIPKKATHGAVQGGTNALADPALRRQIAAFLGSPEMHAIQRELIAGLADSALDALGEEERVRRIDALASRAAARILREARRELPPVAEGITQGAVAGALDAALDPARQRELQRSVGAVVGASVRGVADGLRDARAGAAVSAAMTEQIGPAVQSTLRDDVGPGLAAVLANQDVQRSLGATARLLGREIVLGTTEALAEQKPPPDADSLLSRMTNVARQGAALFGSAAWLLVLIIALLFAWIIKLLAQARRYRSEASRRVATAQLLEEAARAAEGKPWAGELIGALQARVRAEEQALAELRAPRRRGRPPPRERHA